MIKNLIQSIKKKIKTPNIYKNLQIKKKWNYINFNIQLEISKVEVTKKEK